MSHVHTVYDSREVLTAIIIKSFGLTDAFDSAGYCLDAVQPASGSHRGLQGERLTIIADVNSIR